MSQSESYVRLRGGPAGRAAIVDACVQWQKQQPGNQSIAIFVLDPDG